MQIDENKRRWRLILTVVTFLALLGMIFGLRRQILETLLNLRNVNGWALLLMIPLQFLNYFSITKIYQHIFRILGQETDTKTLLRTTAELNFVNNVFPSGGISGFSYFGIKMKSLGIKTGQATLVQMMRFALLFVSFQILLAIGLIILAIDGQANDLAILVSGSLATLLAILTLIVGYVIGSKQRISAFFTYITRAVNRLIQIVRPKYPETISVARVQQMFNDLHDNYVALRSRYRQVGKPLMFALLANTAEVLTIYVVYVAFGRLVNPGAIILAYGIANFAGLVSVLPGGIGIYEVLMTAILVAMGVPPAIGIPATVMYRVLNMLMQLPVGYYFYHNSMTRRQ